MFKLLIESVVLFIVLWYFFFTSYYFIIGKKPKYKRNDFKFTPVIHQLLFDVPKRFSEFLIHQTSREFDEFGIRIFCGEQGQGKTYAMTHEINKIFARFPDVEILTNYDLLIQDKCLDTWQPLLYEKNGDNGIIFAFDEISLWFNSRFRDLNPSVLQECVQNRKNHRVIFGTAQNISMVEKQLRMQTYSYINCHCWFGFFVWCTEWHPVFDFDGNLTDKHFMGFKFYIQDPVIRYQYDTMHTIQRLGKLGFNYTPPSETITVVKEVEKKHKLLSLIK